MHQGTFGSMFSEPHTQYQMPLLKRFLLPSQAKHGNQPNPLRNQTERESIENEYISLKKLAKVSKSSWFRKVTRIF